MKYHLVGGEIGSNYLRNAVSEDDNGEYEIVCSATGPMSAFFMAEAVIAMNNQKTDFMGSVLTNVAETMSQSLYVTRYGKIVKNEE